MSRRSQHLYEFGPYRLDTAEGLLLRDGEPVPLTPKAFETLVALVERSGHLVEKGELIKAVWSDAFVEESNLTSNVYALRKMLGQGEKGRSYIETVPKRGYRFTEPVRALTPETLVVEKRTLTRVVTEETVADDSSQKPLIGVGEALVIDQAGIQTVSSKWRWLLIALLSLSLVIGGIFAYRAVTANRSLTAAPRPQIESIAVLPFKNESGNPDVEYLSDGVTESLINSLSQLPQLKVIARNSSFQYKDKDVNPQEVSQALGVHAILVGRVSQRDDTLVVSIELMDARDKTQVWGERYTLKAKDVQAVQEDIARSITEKLRLKLTGTQEQQLAKRETVNPEAYELLLKGRFHWNKGGTENQKKAVEYYQRAIAADPAYALAYAESSARYYYLVAASVLDPKEFTPKAEAAARKALELDDSLAEAHLGLSAINLTAWNWAAAERECKRAIELSPNLARAHIHYSFYLTFMGRHEQAIAEAKRAKELDPISPNTNSNVGFQLLLARQNDQAIEVAKKTLELDRNYPDAHGLIGYAYAAKGQYPEAIAAYQKAIRLGDDSRDTQIYLGAAYAKAGEREKARAILKRLETGKDYVSPGALAALYVALGEREQAFAALERAYAEHDLQLQFLGVDPNLDPLRSDPRFQDLSRRVGLQS